MDHILFYEITSVLLLAGVIAMVTSLFKQPSVIAFILTGLIVGPFGYYRLHDGSALNALGEIGITLLLFMVGLELDFNRVKQLGKTALATGLGQIIFTTIAGFAIVKLLGFGVVESWYIAIALTFSSTIIVVKLLTEKRELQSLYARIVVGFLVVQDFVALIILLFLGTSSANQPSIFSGLPVWQQVMVTLVKALILFLILMWLSKKVFPHLLRYLGKSDELLLSFALAWALGLAAFTSLPIVGFSLEIGGFLAGLALANSQVHFEIGARIKSIRDFFIIIFFIVFGAQLVFGDLRSILLPAGVLILFVLIIEPIILMLIMGYLGYKPRTSFFASVTVAQVSEFSFILMALGLRLNEVSNRAVSLVTLVGVVTIAISSYMILYSHELYEHFRRFLHVFDFKRGSAEQNLENVVLKDHIILIGVHRLGSHLIETLGRQRHQLVLVDFNPEIAEQYASAGFIAICGDITDPYIQDQVNLPEARLIISTIPDFKSNLVLLDAVKERTAGRKRRPKLIFAAQDENEARHLYENEIDYALSPHFIGGLHLARILKDDHKFAELKKLKQNHLKVLYKGY